MNDENTFTTWRKSSRSSGGDNCVEVAVSAAGGVVGVRDSKQDGRGPMLRFSRTEWAVFLAAVKAGDFDGR
jgi:hypothetical protein